MFKKWIISLVAVTSFSALSADGDFGGDFRVRSTTGQIDTDNPDTALDSFQNFKVRGKLTAAVRPSEALETHGAIYLNMADTLADPTYLAYVNWMFSDEFMLKAGRTTYQVGKGKVIGSNDYEDVPVIFNGLFLSHSSESMGLDIGLVTIEDSISNVFAESTMPANTDADAQTEEVSEEDGGQNVLVSLDFRSFPEWIKTMNAHVISPVEDFNIRAGASIKGGSMGFGYSLTGALNSLNSVDVDNLMVDFGLSQTFEMGDAGIKVHGGYHMEGSNYDAFLYNKHKYAGKLDAVTWGSGMNYASAGMAYMMGTHSKVGLKAYYFTKDKEGEVGTGDMEIDMYYKQAIDSSTSLKVWAGVLKKGSDYQSEVEAALAMKF